MLFIIVASIIFAIWIVAVAFYLRDSDEIEVVDIIEIDDEYYYIID